jgi:hypothetical protein
MIISFAWTTAALLAGRKTVTRRQWARSYAEKFYRGQIIDAYDKQPRFGGKKVAVIQLTHEPSFQLDADIADSDFEHEGFAYMAEHPELIPKNFRMRPTETMIDRFGLRRESGGHSWVIRFKLVQITKESGNV